MRTIVHLL